MAEPYQYDFIAEFTGATVYVLNKEWFVEGVDETRAFEVREAIKYAVENGWPQLAGWSINTDPGWDDKYTKMRFYALGASSVKSTRPQDNIPEEPPPVDTIVG